jgi:FkbM family methyltransferase
MLPWGFPLRYRTHEQTGLSIARRGLFDLIVCETLLRLAEPGEVALDVGANIGHMTSVLSAAVGPGGRVVAFEPHPELFPQLEANVRRWRELAASSQIDLHNCAVSSREGVAELVVGPWFDWNQGAATLEPDPDEDPESLRTIEVQTVRLDDAVRDDVGLAKIDVEGHELSVLQGAEGLLSERRVRDIVFEQTDTPPTPVTRLLERHGYHVLSLDQRLTGLRLGPAELGSARYSGGDPSYLATVDPARATSRLAVRGWAVFGRGPARWQAAVRA